MFRPDYWVSHEEFFQNGNKVGCSVRRAALSSQKISSYAKPMANGLASVVENGLVKEWRLYADKKPVYDILAKSKPQPGN